MKYFIPIILLLLAVPILAQIQISGDLETNIRLYDTDENIGAAGTPFYDWAKFSADSWFSLNMTTKDDFELRLRFDAFQNSPLFTGGFSENNGIGLGYFHMSKKIQKLTLQAGYLYDQFGSGFNFRAFENRGLGLDNAIVGVSAQYDILDNLFIKGFAGKMKNMFGFVNNGEETNFIETFDPVIKGLNVEGVFSIGDAGLMLNPGVSIVNRTIDNTSMQIIATEINNQDLDTRFVPKYNVNAYSVYNTFTYKGFSLFGEYAFKTDDVIRDNSPIFDEDGHVLGSNNLLVEKDGYTAFGSISYSQKGFGVTGSFRKIDHFVLRTSPLQSQTQGLINFLPPMGKQNSLRLPARYQSNAQMLDEAGFQFDVIYKPNKKLVFTSNYSKIWDTANDIDLFQEIYFDVKFKKPKSKWKLLAGFNAVDYNREVYESKGKMINTLTPFTEFTYKFDRKKSVRLELQYMLTKRNSELFGDEDQEPDKLQDFGDWLFFLAEFNIAPKYSFSLSDMYEIEGKNHFYDASVFYTNKANRFSLGYSKQVAGIICTGGVCRFEPAFSGVKFSLTSSF